MLLPTKTKTALAGAMGLVFTVAALNAQGHALWDPRGLIKPRNNRDDIKTGPCGVPRTNTAVTLAAGSTVNLEIERTIFHQGYFRIAFSPANDQGFDSHVLAERIPETSGQRYYTVSVTLPDMECEACTLQLIQVMLDRNPPTNYYSCADIRLVRDTPPDDTQPPGSVGQVLAVPGDGSVFLSWSNPSDADFAGVLITETGAPSTAVPENGVGHTAGEQLDGADIVFFGNGTSATLNDRAAGTHYYRLFTYDQSYNYSPAVAAQATVAATVPNIAPQLSLVAEQGQATVTRVKTDGGPVRVQALLSDANAADGHALTWSVSDPGLVDADQVREQFTFDPAGLAPGTYTVSAQVTDDGEPPLSAAAELTLTVEKPQTSTGGFFGGAWLLFLGALLTLRRNKHPF